MSKRYCDEVETYSTTVQVEENTSYPDGKISVLPALEVDFGGKFMISPVTICLSTEAAEDLRNQIEMYIKELHEVHSGEPEFPE